MKQFSVVGATYVADCGNASKESWEPRFDPTTAKTCPICDGPMPKWRVTCSLPCRYQWQSRQQRGKAPVEKVMEARREQCRQMVQAQARKTFGTLSEREIAIFNYGVKVGHRRGYQTGHRKGWYRALGK